MSSPLIEASDAPQRLWRFGFWPLQNMGWCTFMTVHWLTAVANGKPWVYVGLSISLGVAGWGATFVLHHYFMRIWQLSTGRRMVAAIPAFLLALAALCVANYFAIQQFCQECLPSNPISYFAAATYLGYVLLSWCALWFGIKISKAYHRAEAARVDALLRAEIAKQDAQSAQMQMLRYQLNPHFLFNTLNAVSTLTLTKDHIAAEQMVSALARFLRATLDQAPQQKVSLQQELDVLQLYLEIERVRFADRFLVTIEIAPDAMRATIPSLLLQPLVENTIKHVVAKSEAMCTLSIFARMEQQILDLLIQDRVDDVQHRCAAPADGNGHVGLSNLRQRLQVHYDQGFELDYGPNSTGFYVHMRLPQQAA